MNAVFDPMVIGPFLANSSSGTGTYLNNPAFTQLVKDASAATSLKRVCAIYGKAEQVIDQNVLQFPLYYGTTNYFSRPGVSFSTWLGNIDAATLRVTK